MEREQIYSLGNRSRMFFLVLRDLLRLRGRAIMAVDERKLTDHLDACIELSKARGDDRVATVLRNLKEEVERGDFKVDE